jgi:hypothetical protein
LYLSKEVLVRAVVSGQWAWSSVKGGTVNVHAHAHAREYACLPLPQRHRVCQKATCKTCSEKERWFEEVFSCALRSVASGAAKQDQLQHTRPTAARQTNCSTQDKLQHARQNAASKTNCSKHAKLTRPTAAHQTNCSKQDNCSTPNQLQQTSQIAGKGRMQKN